MAKEKELFRLEQPHGPGEVRLCFQKGSGGYFATTGADGCVCIFSRHGKLEQRIHLPGICLGMDWDCYGDLLAVICAGATTLILWDSNTSKKQNVEIGLRDKLSCLVWAKSGPLLAVGTHCGNVSIYNHSTAKRIPILGKHNKRISGGAWSSGDLLALGSDDKTLSINNADGDTLRIIQLRAEPVQIKFSEMKTDERLAGENTVTTDTYTGRHNNKNNYTEEEYVVIACELMMKFKQFWKGLLHYLNKVSVVVGKKTLFLYNLQDPDNPVELAFQQKYGSIVTYKWFGDGYILLGFMGGYFVAISTHIREVGQELFQAKNHRDCLSDIAISQSLGKVATCGDNTVKIHEIANLQETPSVIMMDEEVLSLGYSEDGQLLALATSSGRISVHLSRLPMLAAAHISKIAMLSSLSQITLYQLSFEKDKNVSSVVINTEVEPSFLAVGPYHIVCGMNNRTWLYDVSKDMNPVLLGDREYLGTITGVCLNTEYTAVLLGSKIHLHYTEGEGSAKSNSQDKEMRLFPEDGEQLNVSCMALTTDFLIYASDMGHLRYFYLEEWTQVSDFRHTVGIKSVFPDHSGTRLILIDVKSDGHLYNPVTDELIPIIEFPATATGVLWDLSHPDRNVFIVFNNEKMFTYIHIRDSVAGPSIKKVGETKLPLDQVPLVMHSGELTLETSGGRLSNLTLSTHALLTQITSAVSQTENLTNTLDRLLALMRYNEAWNICLILDERDVWLKLANSALMNLDIWTAKRVYQQLGDAGMVWSLENIQDIENKKLLAGHVAMFMQDFDLAQELFLESSDPIQALIMRQDLLQWAEALRLATNLDPSQLPYISLQYANQLELMGHYTEALSFYERGLRDGTSDHNKKCRAGIARCAIRCGDYRRGIAMASDPGADKQLKKECAEILEATKKLNEAAVLFERAECFDQAASVYIQLKNWNKLGELLPKVTSPKIHLQYAKGKEAVGDYRSAAKAYYMGKDLDSVVRIDLDHLNDPQEAVRIVQETRSIEGAKMVAKFFQRVGDYPSAIRFLVISGCLGDAFRLSREHKQLELYGDILAEECMDDEANEEFKSLALHFESSNKHYLAGKYCYHAKDYRKAMKHLLSAAKSNNEDSEALTLAIEVVRTANDDLLANQLIELLLGEVDGEARDPKYIFRLYMVRRQYREAAKTAIIIANEEQMNGNYRNAHDVLLGMCQELHNNHLCISTELLNCLMLLHSYILVRLHVRRGDHLKAARMLIRVADNISQFPCHVVPILTSTVIECHRADLKARAFQYAAILMRPEYRSQIEPKYSKKMEGVVRKPPRGKDNKLAVDPPENTSPCPFCDYYLPDTQLNCPQCKNNIPFCIATGRHILKDDLTECPNCHFPAIRSELEILIEGGENCPMCSEKIEVHQLKRLTDVDSYLHTPNEE